MTAIQKGDMHAEARLLAERFHERHQARRGRDEPVPWTDMPPSYQRRLTLTFEDMIRLGLMSPGPSVGFQLPTED